MSHHGNEESYGSQKQRNTITDLLRRAAEAEQLGATNTFPDGQLTTDDEGGLAFALHHVDGKVVINFGKSVSWVGFNPEQAEQVGMLFIWHAREIRLGRSL